MATIKIEMNFVEDVRARCAQELVTLGYTLPSSSGDPHKNAHDTCVDYWNAMNRRIPVRPRAVHWSKELRAREPSLDPEVRNALAAIEQESGNGEDLNRRYSKSLKKLQYNDLMLHDWGIHHLHLGLAIEKDGFFVERTGDLLFVLRRDDDLYLLDVRAHGAWTDADLVEIVHTNWPDTIAQYRLKGLTGPALSPVQRKNLRDRNGNAGILMQDGTFYMAIGGGIVGSGDNLRAIVWADRTLATARALQDHTWNAEELADKIAEAKGDRPEQINLRLGHLGDDHAIIEVEPSTEPFRIRVNFS
jgi:hypothetical protein